jgi:hypothetical protein
MNPAGEGTKVAGLYVREIPARGSTTICARLTAGQQGPSGFDGFDDVFTRRIAEAGAFYAALQRSVADEDMRRSASGLSGYSTVRGRCLPAATSSSPMAQPGWRCFASTCWRIAIELSQRDPVYEDTAIKFLEHFLYIARAMTDMGKQGIGLWDDVDNFL